jgi:DNA-binding CsgD family transcriptional regulator
LWLVNEQNWELVDVFEYRCDTQIHNQSRQHWIAYNTSCQGIKWLTKINEAAITAADKEHFLKQPGNVNYNHHTLSVISGLNEQPVSIIQLYRNKITYSSFTKEDAILLNRIAPHVAQAITLDMRLSEMDSRLIPGILVYSATGELLFRTRRSRELLPDYAPEDLLTMACQPDSAKNPVTHCYLHTFTPNPNSLLYWIDNSDTATNLKPIYGKQKNTVVVAQPFQFCHIIKNRLLKSQLSPREFDVALATIQGLSNAEIASQLCIDETTVKDHLRRVYTKMSVRSRTALVSRVLNLDKELAGLRQQRKKATYRKNQSEINDPV